LADKLLKYRQASGSKQGTGEQNSIRNWPEYWVN